MTLLEAITALEPSTKFKVFMDSNYGSDIKFVYAGTSERAMWGIKNCLMKKDVKRMVPVDDRMVFII